jgi:hypothetical protein
VWFTRRRRSSYAIEIARSPIAVGGMLVAIAVAVMLGPGVGVTMIGAVAAATWISSGHEPLQLRLDRARAREALRQTRDARETRLEEVGAPRAGLTELTELVDRIITTGTAAGDELEGLLDSYAELTISVCRIRQLIAETEVPDVSNTEPSLRSAVVRRRTAQIREWRERCQASEQLIASITARVRHLAQHGATLDS